MTTPTTTNAMITPTTAGHPAPLAMPARWWRSRGRLTWTAAAFAALVLVLIFFNRGHDQKDILDAAYALKDGGGYCGLTDSGVPRAVMHKGITILPASKGSYCCGFTFFVAMQIAEQRGLLKEKSAYEVKRAQREWYGATKASPWKQCAMAVEKLGIGREVEARDARPGDFVAVHRVRGAGHSVVFLDWVKHEGVIVGFKYRSSQPSTDGVGDATEYFTSSGYKGASVDPKHFYVARLNAS